MYIYFIRHPQYIVIAVAPIPENASVRGVLNLCRNLVADLKRNVYVNKERADVEFSLRCARDGNRSEAS